MLISLERQPYGGHLASACVQCPKCLKGYCGHDLIRHAWLKSLLTSPAPWQEQTELRSHLATGECADPTYGVANAMQRWVGTIYKGLTAMAAAWKSTCDEGLVISPESLGLLTQLVTWEVMQANEEPDTIRWAVPSEDDQYGASIRMAAEEQASHLTAVELCEKVAKVAEDKCPVCNVGTETGDGFDVSTVTCYNADCAVKSFCVQRMKVIKKKPSAGLVACGTGVLAKCTCSSAPKGEDCFNER